MEMGEAWKEGKGGEVIYKKQEMAGKAKDWTRFECE